MSPLLTNDQSPRCGPLHAQIYTHLMLLEERGYKQNTIRPDWLLLTDLDDWLARKAYRLIDLNETVLEHFLNYHMQEQQSPLHRAGSGTMTARARGVPFHQLLGTHYNPKHQSLLIQPALGDNCRERTEIMGFLRPILRLSRHSKEIRVDTS